MPLPFELTAETGFRIQAAVEQSYREKNQTIPEVMVTSLANGYTGYITTPEEYEVQYYEGGHTIYGRYSQPYVTQHIGALAADLLTHNKVMELPAVNQEAFWYFDWQDITADHIALHQPLLSIEISDDQQHWQPLIHKGRPVNDQGYDLSVHLIDDQDGHAHYRAYWYNPVFQGKQVWYRFVIQPREHEAILYSAAFH